MLLVWQLGLVLYPLGGLTLHALQPNEHNLLGILAPAILAITSRCTDLAMVSSLVTSRRPQPRADTASRADKEVRSRFHSQPAIRHRQSVSPLMVLLRQTRTLDSLELTSIRAQVLPRFWRQSRTHQRILLLVTTWNLRFGNSLQTILQRNGSTLIAANLPLISSTTPTVLDTFRLLLIPENSLSSIPTPTPFTSLSPTPLRRFYYQTMTDSLLRTT